MSNSQRHFLDYRLKPTEIAYGDLEAFWKWFRADNQSIARLLDSVVSQRIFLTPSGPASLLERVEVVGLEGAIAYFQQLAAAKANLDAQRAPTFFGLVDVTDLRLRALAPVSLSTPRTGELGVYVTETFKYRHAARSDMPAFWEHLRSSHEALETEYPAAQSVEVFTEVIGQHDEFVQWVRFSDESHAVGYLNREVPSEPTSLMAHLYAKWIEPISRSLLREVPNT